MNKKFGKHLAQVLFKNNITKIPIVLNSEQYEAFVKEWERLEYNMSKSAQHPTSEGENVR